MFERLVTDSLAGLSSNSGALHPVFLSIQLKSPIFFSSLRLEIHRIASGELWDSTSLGDVCHGPICLGGFDSTIGSQVAVGVFRSHGRLQEGQESPDGGEVHPAVVHDGVALVREVVCLAVPAYRHVLVHVAPLNGRLVTDWRALQGPKVISNRWTGTERIYYGWDHYIVDTSAYNRFFPCMEATLMP